MVRITVCVVLLSACLVGCTPAPEPGPPAFTVLSWNLDHYGPADRSGDRQAGDLKPDAHIAAIMRAIAASDADLVVLQEMGNPVLFDGFRQRLAGAGADYPHHLLVEAEDADRYLALLSRAPLRDARLHTEDRYSIGGTPCRVERGFIEASVEAAPGRWLRVVAAHLRSRDFHPLGQTEMRRNEARILGQHLRRIRREFPSEAILLAGTLNDLPGSSIVRDVMGEGDDALRDVRPADAYGDAWTASDPGSDLYERIDYLLLGGAGGWRAAAAEILHRPDLREASRHRPLLVRLEAVTAR